MGRLERKTKEVSASLTRMIEDISMKNINIPSTKAATAMALTPDPEPLLERFCMPDGDRDLI
jgi:hypothetical protein